MTAQVQLDDAGASEAGPAPLRLIVADDSMLFREGLVRVLTELGFDVVAQTDNPADLVRRACGLNVDVALVDVRMPPTHTDEGLRAAMQLAELAPQVGVLVLSQYVESSPALRVLETGPAGRGYLLKDRVGDLDTFAAAIRRVGSGRSVIDPEVVAALVQRRRGYGRFAGMSEREYEILGLVAQGRSNGGICERLSLSTRTVESHVRAVFRKLDLDEAPDDHRRVLAVLAFLASGPT